MAQRQSYCDFISIHALREEGDPFCPVRPEGRWRFLSTPSARRATDRGPDRAGGRRISIHALREEGDEPFIVQITASSLFLSTPSARRATDPEKTEEGDPEYFYPRPPRGGRQPRIADHGAGYPISIHALREEGDKLRRRMG